MLTEEKIRQLVKDGKMDAPPKLKKVAPVIDPTARELKHISRSLLDVVERTSKPDEAITSIINSLLAIIDSLKEIHEKESIVNVAVPEKPTAWEFKIERNERRELTKVKAKAV